MPSRHDTDRPITTQEVPVAITGHEYTNDTDYHLSRAAVLGALETENIESIRSVLTTELYNRRSEDLTGLTTDEQVEKLATRACDVLPSHELKTRIEESKQTGTPLNVKYGIDPTGSDVHIGHAVPMLLLDRMRRMGHDITFIVGDFTAKVGDPSGRVASRPVLTDEQIAENMATYSKQIAPLFDMDGVKIVHNGDWLNNFPMSELMGVLSKVSASQTLQRNDFRGRLDSGLTLAEVMYPVAMALDSVNLDTDIEIGGKDQLLNMQMCRTVMGIYDKRPEVIITTDIMEGTDGSGRKMGKSYDNYVGLTQDPSEIYGRIMSIPDTLLEQYYKMITEIEDNEWSGLQQLMESKKVNPMDVKKILAYDLVHVLHGDDAATAAEAEFTARFSKKDYKEVRDMPTMAVESDTTPKALVGLVAAALGAIRGKTVSNNEVRRIMTQGGVRAIDAEGTVEKVTSLEDMKRVAVPGRTLRLGKAFIQVTGNSLESE